MLGRVRPPPAYAVDNFGVKGGCFMFPSNQNTHPNLNFVLIKKVYLKWATEVVVLWIVKIEAGKVCVNFTNFQRLNGK